MKLLRRETVVATPGEYIDITLKGTANKGDDLQKIIKTKVANCRVCALGAAMVSYVRLYDKVKVGAAEVSGTDGYYDYGKDAYKNYEGLIGERPTETLSKLFSTDQLDLIETAFERMRMGSLDSDAGYEDGSPAEAALEFGGEYYDPEVRLKAIMKNIIKNEGTFRP